MKIYYFILRVLRKIYYVFFLNEKKLFEDTPDVISDADIASEKIYDLLVSDKPCMITRFGANEASILSNYIAINGRYRSAWNFIRSKSPAWWWDKNTIRDLHVESGFFPTKKSLLEEYCKLALLDIPQIDILGAWQNNTSYFDDKFSNHIKVKLNLLEPYFSNAPWSRALEGKKVLVIHPFQKSIEQQYEKRKLLFKNNLLPNFELKTIKAVQTLAHEKSEFKTWFEALDSMKQQMDKIDYDIALIGCGAYGFNLAAHAKRMGKKSFHLGGALQVLFGILGKRYENPKHRDGFYLKLFNEHWTRPTNEEKPQNSKLVENDCYW